MANYICTELVTIRNIYGGYDCANWTEQQESVSLVPTLNPAEQDQITMAIIGVFVLVWGWQQIKAMIR